MFPEHMPTNLILKNLKPIGLDTDGRKRVYVLITTKLLLPVMLNNHNQCNTRNGDLPMSRVVKGRGTGVQHPSGRRVPEVAALVGALVHGQGCVEGEGRRELER